MATAGVNISVFASVEQAQRALQQVQRELEKVGNVSATADARVRRSAQGMVSSGKKMTLGLTLPLGFAVKKMVDASSGLNEAIDANRVIFGAHAEQLDEWSQTLAESAGLSSRAALSASAAFGNMLKTVGLATDQNVAMSQTLVQLAGDMASFNDQDPTEMLERLRSGLAGEAEPLRRFGVLLSAARVEQEAVRLGIARANQELTEAQKVQARYAIILKDTAAQQGNFTLTAESVANQTRTTAAEAENAAASFGQVLTPVTKELLRITRGLVGVFDDMPGPAKTATLAIIGIAAVSGPILTVVGNVRLLGLWLKKLRTEGALSADKLKTSLARLSRAINPVTVAAAGAVAVFAAWWRQHERNRAASQAFADALRQEQAGIAGATNEAIVAMLREADLMDDLRGAGIPLARAFAVVRGESELTTKEIEALADAQSLLSRVVNAQVFGDAAGEFKRLTEVFRVGRDEAAQLGNELGETGSAVAQTRRAVASFARLTGADFTRWRKQTITALDPVEAALDKLADKAKVTSDKIIKAFKRQTKNLTEYRKNLEDVRKRNIPDAVLKQILDMGTEGADILAALADANKKEFREIVRSMRDARKELRLTQDAINGLKGKEVDVGVNVSGGGKFPIKPQFRAAGGPVVASRPFVVGERGPELFIPKRDGTIVPNGGVIGGGGVTVNVTMNVTGATDGRVLGRQLVDEVERELRARQGRRTSPLLGHPM